MTEAIDLTPRGLLTPEGAERVNTAVQELENANAAVANKAAELLAEYHHLLLDAANGVLIAQNDRTGFREALNELNALDRARKQKQEEFLRAVAGVQPV